MGGRMARPAVLAGTTYQVRTGCGSAYITINFMGEGPDRIPFELFIRAGKAGGCMQAQTETLGRLLSYHMRSGNLPDRELIMELVGIKCHQVADGRARSCGDAIARVLADVMDFKLSSVEHDADAVDTTEDLDV